MPVSANAPPAIFDCPRAVYHRRDGYTSLRNLSELTKALKALISKAFFLLVEWETSKKTI
jgi:hypothetical protein